MSNIVPRLRQQLTDSHQVVSRYHEGDVARIQSELEQLFGERTPQVMLYGAYNAGKSTLVNALLGSEKAPVQDVPTTFKVDRYLWNGLCLLDTPGINAPVEHEQATAEQVQKCGLMLFVIREGDQDVKGIYQRLFGMVQRGKQVFIVLNCESSQPELMAQVLARVNGVMAEMGPGYGVDDATISAIPVCPVNLASALNGRLKDSQTLLDCCGYTALAERLAQWLVSYNHETQQMATLCSAVNELWFQPAWVALSQRLGKQQDSALARIQQNRTMLERDKRLLEHTAFTFIQQQVNGRKGEIMGVIQAGGHQDQLKTLFAGVGAQIEGWLGRELESTVGNITTVISPVIANVPSDTENNPVADMAWQLARKGICDEKNLTRALKLGRNLKIPLLKGRWDKTLASWGGKAAGVFQVALVAYDVYSAGKREDEANRAERERAISLGQCVEATCTDAQQALYATAQQHIALVFNQHIAELDREANMLLSQQGELEKDRDYLAKAMGKLA